MGAGSHSPHVLLTFLKSIASCATMWLAAHRANVQSTWGFRLILIRQQMFDPQLSVRSSSSLAA